MKSELAKGSLIDLEIVDLAYGGLGVAKPNGFVVFVKGGLPGDRLRARITKKTKNHANAEIESIDRPSEKRVQPPCPIFGHCGGCTWQDLDYEEQLHWKHKQVGDTLEHLGGLTLLPEIRPMIASPEIWNYRNKMEFSFGVTDAGPAILGFHFPARWDKIFEVRQCLIHPKPFDNLLAVLGEYTREHALPAYNQKTHQGFLRHAVMRHSRTTGGVVLVLITAGGELPEPQSLIDRLKARCPELQGFVWGINPGFADVATIQGERLRWGDPVLEEQINGLAFKISPESFFQTNTLGAERLYQVVVEWAELRPRDRVLDAYCGAGSIGLHCASRVAGVIGLEISREAVWDARLNAQSNRISNARFIAGPLNETLPLARGSGAAFTRVIIDPPRGGMDKKSLAMLLNLRAPVFVYVSCNPATLARDLQTAHESGYSIDAIQPVDMFPHTHHIEVVVRLKLRSSS